MASYSITVYVEDIASVIALFDKVRIYRSTTGNEADRVLHDSFSLVAGTSTYEWIDTSGSDSYVAWFTYINSGTLVESGFSDLIQYGSGSDTYVPGFSFSGSTYPVEFSLSQDERDTVYALRYYIGDLKTVKREYLSPTCTNSYQSVSDDGYTYKLGDKGWPLKVVKDDVEYTSSYNPYVADYSYLTFSGTEISTTSGTLDVWYEKFRHSDRELLKVFNAASGPVYLSTANTTDKVLCLSAAIIIIRAEIAALMGETSGSITLLNEISYNPEPLLRQKRELLADLQAKLDETVDDLVSFTITGVRVE